MTVPTKLFDLTGKVAIVTGSTKGIGRAMVEGLAARRRIRRRQQPQARPVRTGREGDRGGDRIACVPARLSRRRLGCHPGVRRDGSVASSGRIDVLVNNAGITPSRLTVSTMELGVWRKIFNVNVEGPLRTAQCVAPIMRDQGGGSIVNIGSMAGVLGRPGVCAYAASKAALINLTKSMAQEWAPWNVRVNVLSPGPFVSEMVEGAERNAPGFKDMIAAGTLHAARRRPARDRRPGALPRERRVVVRHRRRHLRVRRHAEMTVAPDPTAHRRFLVAVVSA